MASWAGFKAGCRRFFGAVPIIGPLVHCRIDDHKGAFREFFIVLLFATATFWLSALLLMANATMRDLGYPHVLYSTVRTGELFIFTLGFIGPVLINAGDDPKTARAFPGRMWHLLALLVLGIIATGFHAQLKNAQAQGRAVQSDLDFFFHVSFVLACCAVVLRYLSMVYRKQTFVPERDIKGKEQDFARQYQQHLKEGGDQ